MDKMKCETVSGVERNVDKIAAMFPQVVTEVKGEDGKIRRAVKWDVLKELLSGEYVEGGECYDFTWPGKRAAIAEAAKSIRKTLRPCKEESKDWDTTENLYIEGDNLEVLKLLQESYLGKVKMIYIDPPYNTGNDFVYKDKFVKNRETSESELDLFDAESNNRTMSGELFKNTEANGRFHSDWCSMIYPRLVLARDLLSDDGVIFISIGEHEVCNLKKCCVDIFGEQNFIETYVWESTFRPDNSSKIMRRNAEFVICVAKNKANITELLGEVKSKEGLPSLTKSSMKESILKFPENSVITYLPDGIYKAGVRDSYELLDDVTVKAGKIVNSFSLKGRMIWSQDNLVKEMKNGTEIIIKGDGFVPYTKKPGDSQMSPSKIIPNTIVGDILSSNAEMAKLFDDKVFSYPKPVTLLSYFIRYFRDQEFIVVDFFAGSATTAEAVMTVNAESGGKRRFIMVQLPENLDENLQNADDKEKVIIRNAISLCDKLGCQHTICEVSKERIRRAGEKIKEEAGLAAADLDVGFRVFKVADSNMKDVYYSADEYKQKTLDELISNIKEDRTDLDLLYGCLLEWGVELSLPHSSETIDGVTVHTVNNGDLIACFDPNIPESAIRAIAKRQPLRAVFRDSSFASAPQKINVEEIFKLLSPATTVKVI